MRIHVTRHAQPGPYVPKPGDDPQIPPGDKGITELGERQSLWLGERLVELGFKGTIHSSPYHRTMQTAQIAAEIIGTRIRPEPAIQEYVPNPGLPDGVGQTLEQIHGRYANIAHDAALQHPWFVTGPEDQEAVQRRVKPFIDQLVDRQAEDVLLVGHGATIWACFEVIKGLGEIVGGLPELNNGWNCSLSTYDVDAQLRTQILQLFDVSHMPPECVSSNGEYLVPRDHS